MLGARFRSLVDGKGRKGAGSLVNFLFPISDRGGGEGAHYPGRCVLEIWRSGRTFRFERSRSHNPDGDWAFEAAKGAPMGESRGEERRAEGPKWVCRDEGIDS